LPGLGYQPHRDRWGHRALPVRLGVGVHPGGLPRPGLAQRADDAGARSWRRLPV